MAMSLEIVFIVISVLGIIFLAQNLPDLIGDRWLSRGFQSSQQSACNSSSFPINLQNKLCYGLTGSDAPDINQCTAACCTASPTCLVWQWRPASVPACWIGSPTDCNRDSSPAVIYSGARQEATCSFGNNAIYPDGTKSVSTAIDVNDCCNQCSADSSCSCWSWNLVNQTCFLKSICNPVRQSTGFLAGFTRNPTGKTDTLYVGQTLAEGSALYSQNGSYVAQLLPNGPLAIYSTSLTRIVATPTGSGPHPYIIQVQGDCTFTITDSAGSQRWNSNTQNLGVGSCKLKMGNDGNLVLLDSYNQVVWSSGTPPNCASRTNCQSCTQLSGCSWCFGNGTMGSSGSCRSLWDSRCVQNAATTSSDCTCSSYGTNCNTCLQYPQCQFCPGDNGPCQSKTKKCTYGPTVNTTSQCSTYPWCRGQTSCQTCTNQPNHYCQWCSIGCGYRSLNASDSTDAVCYPRTYLTDPTTCTCTTNSDCYFGNATKCEQINGVCSAGICSYPPAPPGTSCGGGKYCSMVNYTCEDLCTGLTCNSGNPSACQQRTGTCSAGKCTYPSLPAGTLCDPKNTSTCSSSGTCVCQNGFTGAACNVAANCGQTRSSPSAPPCIPGADDGPLYGFDIVTNQKKANRIMGIEAGSTIVEILNPWSGLYTPYTVPNGIYAEKTSQFTYGFTGTYQSSFQYSSQWSVKLGVTNYRVGQFGNSGQLNLINERLKLYSRMTSSSQTDYYPIILHAQTSSAPFHPYFLSDVAALPPNYSYSAYSYFMGLYGNYMVNLVPVGGQIYADLETSYCSIKNVNSIDLNVQASSLFQTITASANGPQQIDQSYQQNTRSTLEIIGGDQSLLFPNQSFVYSNDWLPTVYSNLQPLKYTFQVTELWTLMYKIDVLKSYHLYHAYMDYCNLYASGKTLDCGSVKLGINFWSFVFMIFVVFWNV